MRQCRDCSLCCKLVPVAELNKPAGKWCNHCKPGNGCTIYQSRPDECRSFMCEWLSNPEFPDHWRPLKSRMVIYAVGNSWEIVSESPSRWQEEPYYSDLKAIAIDGLSRGFRTVLRIGARTIPILPN